MESSVKKTAAILTLACALALPVAGHAQEGVDVSGLAEGLMALDGSAEAGTEAPTGWYTCDVVRTGAGWGNHYVALTCPTFTNVWHILSDAQKDAMLATALAAATSDNQVQVFIQEQSGYDEILALYLQK